jgi:hypothetical protein
MVLCANMANFGEDRPSQDRSVEGAVWHLRFEVAFPPYVRQGLCPERGRGKCRDGSDNESTCFPFAVVGKALEHIRIGRCVGVRSCTQQDERGVNTFAATC